MFVKSFASYAVLTALCVPHAFAAVVSLYIPDDNGIPYAAEPIGTDGSGHTTWRLGFGSASGTFTATRSAGGPSATLVEGSTDLHVFGGIGATAGLVKCGYPAPTASDGTVVAACTAELSDGSTTLVQGLPPVTMGPVPMQLVDDKSQPTTAGSGKSQPNSAGNLRMSLGGVGVSALAILGTAGMMLVRM